MLFLFISLLASGCEVVGGIFKAGYYTGLILVFIVILLILFLIGYFRKK
ncbi:MAG: hypothetical protein ACKOW2_05275 [Sphingobacteriaceae bacterium]